MNNLSFIAGTSLKSNVSSISKPKSSSARNPPDDDKLNDSFGIKDFNQVKSNQSPEFIKIQEELDKHRKNNDLLQKKVEKYKSDKVKFESQVEKAMTD